MNAKLYIGNVQPNPKEFKVWVTDEGAIKTWNGLKWVEQSNESSEDDENNGGGDSTEEEKVAWEEAQKSKDTNVIE